MAKLTHTQFAERVAYKWQLRPVGRELLTGPEKVNGPMSAHSVRRFINEMQRRLDLLQEDLAALEAVRSPALLFLNQQEARDELLQRRGPASRPSA